MYKKISLLLLVTAFAGTVVSHTQPAFECPTTKLSNGFLSGLSRSVSSQTKILLPSSDGYSQALHHWSETAEVQSAAVVRPKTSKDLSNIIKLAAGCGVDFAVVAGGHNNDGASSTEGLLIDLSQFNQVRVSGDKKTVTVGAGLRWGAVYEQLTPYNISLVGGRVSSVGVGGFTLGGGYGWKSGEYGLAADNIISAEMVLANGKIVTVSPTKNEDLYFGIRGGGGQFGVVTKFMFRALPQENLVYSGFYSYNKDQVKDVAVAMEHWVAGNNDAKAGVMLIFARPPPTFDAVPIVLVWYDGPASIGKPVFKAFQDINPDSDSTAEMTFAVGNTLQDSLVTDGDRKTMSSVAWKAITSEKILKAHEFYVNFTASVPDAAQSSVLIEPVFSGAFDTIKDSDSAYPHGEVLHVIGLVPRWTNSTQDSTVKSWISQGTSVLRSLENHNIVYPNYSIYSEPLENMFGENLDKLTALKSKHDPKCLFRHGFVFQTRSCSHCPAPASW